MMSARLWTSDQKQQQREVIQNWRPWEHSTGPRSNEGKARVSRNAYKGGLHSQLRAATKGINQILRIQKTLLSP